MLLLTSLVLVSLASACPKACRCAGRGRVFCNDRNLREIPLGLPVDTKILFLQDNKLINSPELTDRLEQLIFLEKVMLHNNELVSFPAFRSNSLRELNLQGNQIERIDGNADFPNLDILNLDDNNLSNQHWRLGFFDKMPKMRMLTMDKNLLTKFPVGLPESLETLTISSNKIETFSLESGRPLINLEVLRMDKNKINDQVIIDFRQTLQFFLSYSVFWNFL